MINLYLSDFILGLNNSKNNLCLDNVVYEFEKLFTKIADIKKNYKYLVGEMHSFENHQICGYSLKDDIIKKINNQDIKYYILSILTKSPYITRMQPETISFNNITYQSSITKECYTNNGILISSILNNQFINRLPYHENYINIMHQMNDEYICKFIELDDSFYICRIYLNMLNSGYNLYFHTNSYNSFCEKNIITYADAIEYRINSILNQNHFENYDGDIIKHERGKIYAIRNRQPMYRIYFIKTEKNIYFLELTNNHNDAIINNKLDSAEQRYKEKDHLKDICDMDDNRCKRKK